MNQTFPIQLIDIQQSGFSAENLLQVVLQRDKLVNGLMKWLHEGNKQKWVDDQQNQLIIRVLKICVVQYGYYQLLQGYNFITPEDKYAGMSNQFYKIFEDEQQYKEEINQFKKLKTRQANVLREDLEKRMNVVLRWKKKFMVEYDQIKGEFVESNPEYIKFYKLKQQIEAPDQTDFDIYQYYFSIFFQEKWIKQPVEQNSIEILRLYSFIQQFLRLDTVYPIEYYANQSVTLLDINENDPQKDYYIKIIQQK